MSKENFKEFIKDKPYLVDYINEGKMTWQNFYEIYDIYGENNEVWNKYKKENKLYSYLSKINTDEITSNLEKASKAIDILKELSTPVEEITEVKEHSPIDNLYE